MAVFSREHPLVSKLPTLRGRTHLVAGRGNMIKRWKYNLRDPVPIYRLTKPVDVIMESIEKEKRNVIAGQAAVVRKLRLYFH